MRQDDDSWDLASSVGATATMVAAARALASREPDALITDPYAEPLVRAVGNDFFTRLIDGRVPAGEDDGGAARLITDVMAVRTRFFDDFFLDASRAGVRQAVILASGLDSRAYRLPWDEPTTVFELDQPRVIDAKSATMADIGATPTCDRRTVAVDLRDDWPAALRAAGFDASVPTAWSAEGLLIYLPPDAQDRLFDLVTELSAPGSRLATEYHPDGGAILADRAKEMNERWREHGFDVDLSGLVYSGDRHPVADYLTDLGWSVSGRTRPEVFAHYGRAWTDADVLNTMRGSVAITAIKDQGAS
ncbi:class I SAM-dependent methyltransferase [Mycolicibacterium grossiae]|uniref:S-adenosyl-L-methionine-dependent methyltransferase n=1 Tax=Mycolicibacterium grossiae TaxID=1552759 RepID=A0A1E8Q787_9MYCO|nr:class I SAM-dependent methyltransferase [Mycolicibacterium grossiae]OFJ54295.1 SAM-dependent methyltransferase [Mycolicibacterium grossiae]QEM45325.1 class I SAM-dependent methyltransferase [Mycolicibacterium grossiae]